MATEALTDDHARPVALGAEIAGGLTVTVHESLAAAEPAWRALETCAVMTPYQRFDWIAHYLSAGFEPGTSIAIAVVAERGAPIALLPLSIVRRFGLQVGRIIGMPISNIDALIFDPTHVQKLTPAVLRAVFSALGKAGRGVDLMSFHCLFADWQGVPNPLLAFPHNPAPNNFYFNTVGQGEGSFIEHALPHKRRTNIRRSARRLAEGFGELELRRAATPSEIDMVQSVFLDQRAKRFVQMGVENIFGNPEFRAFFRSLALASVDADHPALCFHALYAGDVIVATSVGTFTGSHYSQYINSTADGEAAKYTLMGVTLSLLVEELRGRGVVSFDMGLGDFDYKTDWTRPVEVFDCVIPVSPLGSLAAPVLRGARALKRRIKQTPALWSLARRVMALRTRLRQARTR